MIHALRQKRRRATRRRAAGGGPVLRLPNMGTTVCTHGWDATIGSVNDFNMFTYDGPKRGVISVDDATVVSQAPSAGNPAGHNLMIDLGYPAAAIARLDITYRFKQEAFNTGEYVDLWNSNAGAWLLQQNFTTGAGGDIRTYTQAITANIDHYVGASERIRLRHYQHQIKACHAAYFQVLVTLV